MAGSVRGPGVKYAPEEIADAGMIDAFKMKTRNWWATVQKLRATTVPVSLSAEKNALLSRAETVKNAILKVTSLSDSLRIPGLAALPLVPIALIASALGAIAYWANDYATFVKKIQYQRDLVTQGVPAAEAARIADEAYDSRGPVQKAMDWVGGNLVKVGLFAGAGFLAWQFFKKQRR